VFGIGRDSGEVAVLETLLQRKIDADLPRHRGNGAAPSDVEEMEVEFVKLQFGAPMRNYTRWGGWYGVGFTFLSLAALISGLASSGIAAGWNNAHWERWSILVLGLVAAVAAVINQVWRPGQKSAGRTKGGNALRREAWEYLGGRGPYANVEDPEEAFRLFSDQVSKIVRAAEEIDEVVPSEPTLAKE
jgi:hypothetical protein